MENTAVDTNNEGLVPLYDRMYRDGTLRFTTSMSETSALLHKTDWRGKTVLEVGCGEGDLAAMIGIHGAERVTAVDFAQSGIDTAQNATTSQMSNSDAATSKMSLAHSMPS